jgi:hypothetical protein
MKLNKSNACKHLVTRSHIKWQSCESTKLKCKRLNCQQLDLVKLCNYVLISCVVLVGIINGSNSHVSDAILGCSSNPCVFGVCIDEING